MSRRSAGRSKSSRRTPIRRCPPRLRGGKRRGATKHRSTARPPRRRKRSFIAEADRIASEMCALRHSPRTGRRMDRPRLAGRFRGFPVGLSRPRTLQRFERHRALSRRACGGDRQRAVRCACARRPSASAQEPEKPQRAALGARARHRRAPPAWARSSMRLPSWQSVSMTATCSATPIRRQSSSPTN